MSEEWSSLDGLVEAYTRHLRRTRGLREQTLGGNERLVRLFVRASLGDTPIDPRQIGCSDVVEFVAVMQARFSPRSLKAVRTALRSFFRLLRASGLCDERLEAAIPRVAFWRRGAGSCGAGIERSSSVWRAWGCVLGRSPRFGSRTSTGAGTLCLRKRKTSCA